MFEGALRTNLSSSIQQLTLGMMYLHTTDGAWMLPLSKCVSQSKIAEKSIKPLLLFTLCYLLPSFGVTPSNLWTSFTVPETRVFQAADGEDLVILACTVCDWSTRVTDGQTDRQTDGRTELRWLRRAESSSCFRAQKKTSPEWLTKTWYKYQIFSACSLRSTYAVCILGYRYERYRLQAER